MRVALLVDPITLRQKGGDHAPELARQLLGRGHLVQGFGAPPGVIPHSALEPTGDGLNGAAGRGLQRYRPDVLVAYDALSPTAWWAARAARRLGAALVLVEVGIAQLPRLHARLLQCIGEHLWGRYVRNTARTVVALDPVAEALARAEGFDEQRIALLPQGVDLDHFRPGLSSAQLGRHHIRGRMLLYVGRLETSRGVDTLLHAFAATVGQRDDWTLVLAGEGGARARLRATADQLGVASRTRWLPRPRREELPALLGAATLVAVPALDDAVRGKQIARAMACGVPTLVSDLPRLTFLTEHEVTGLVARPGDLAHWTDSLQHAAGSPMALKRWGQTARQRAEARLSWAAIAAEFEAVLEAARERAAA